MLPAASGAPGTRLRFGRYIRHGWMGTEFLIMRRYTDDGAEGVMHATVNGLVGPYERAVSELPTEELAGRVAVVTGGGAGLGEAMAHAFAGAGMAVAVLDIDATPRPSAAASIARAGAADDLDTRRHRRRRSVAAAAEHVRDGARRLRRAVLQRRRAAVRRDRPPDRAGLAVGAQRQRARDGPHRAGVPPDDARRERVPAHRVHRVVERAGAVGAVGRVPDQQVRGARLRRVAARGARAGGHRRDGALPRRDDDPSSREQRAGAAVGARASRSSTSPTSRR